MVFWEITLGTAYFLGLKRTYRLALKIQRRVIKPKHTKIRQFVHRRTRAVFDVALKVHRNIQERDIEVGRNLGNWILRWLDCMKPSAEIRGPPEKPLNAGNTSVAKQENDVSTHKTHGNIHRTAKGYADSDSRRHHFSTQIYPSIRPFPTTAMTMRPPHSGTTTNIQYRQYFVGPQWQRPDKQTFCFNGVIRNDIRQWMLQI